MREYLAIDIGASSGRHVLGRVENGKMIVEEIYRFKNGYRKEKGQECWDIDGLYQEILQGLKECKKLGRIPVSMGIDTWGVDFVLLDSAGKRLGEAVAYRDKRTAGMDKYLEEKISFSQLYKRTGIQKQSFNTIYQLIALKHKNPEQLEQAERMLFISDYLHYLLSGKAVNEYTVGTTSSLVVADKKEWDQHLLESIGVKSSLFDKLYMPGEVIGGFSQPVQEEVGFDCTVVLPATHDTASAFLAVPARDEHAVFISSGTWSLLGIEQLESNITEKGMRANFTNEGGYQGRFRYLKNIMGLWIIQSIRRNCGEMYSFADLEKFARENESFESFVEVNDQRFLAPEDMQDEVKKTCKETGMSVPETLGQVMQCVYKSLARNYKATICELEEVTGKKFTSINIVGGGSKDQYLNELTAKETGLPVYAGPTEGTALGNLMVQMITDRAYETLEEARRAIKKSFIIKEING